MNIKNVLQFIIAILIPYLAGFIGSLFTDPSIPNWYAGIQKSSLNPPNWIFGPVWTILYLLMGIAFFLVLKKSNHPNPRERIKGITLFLIQISLNAFWSIVFFGFQSPGWSFVVLIILWLLILWTMIVFKKISKTAFYLLLPYILWVSFAGYLNYSIMILN